MVTRPLDPVAKRLAAAGNENADSVIDWLAGQQQRGIMDRNAMWCTAGGWIGMTVAAIISSAVAVRLSLDARTLFSQGWLPDSHVPWSVIYLPIVLVAIAVFLTVGGSIIWWMGGMPGLRTTRSAIDWAAVSDAMTRLLSVGCTYPEAFRTAAAITRTRSSRGWLTRAAARVERGEGKFCASNDARGDSAIVELLVDPGDCDPARQWQMASDHFFEVAQRRLILLLGSMPVLSTILSGLLIWVSISATLGWMWKAVAEMLAGLR